MTSKTYKSDYEIAFPYPCQLYRYFFMNNENRIRLFLSENIKKDCYNLNVDWSMARVQLGFKHEKDFLYFRLVFDY